MAGGAVAAAFDVISFLRVLVGIIGEQRSAHAGLNSDLNGMLMGTCMRGRGLWCASLLLKEGAQLALEGGDGSTGLWRALCQEGFPLTVLTEALHAASSGGNAAGNGNGNGNAAMDTTALRMCACRAIGRLCDPHLQPYIFVSIDTGRITPQASQYFLQAFGAVSSSLLATGQDGVKVGVLSEETLHIVLETLTQLLRAEMELGKQQSGEGITGTGNTYDGNQLNRGMGATAGVGPVVTHVCTDPSFVPRLLQLWARFAADPFLREEIHDLFCTLGDGVTTSAAGSQHGGGSGGGVRQRLRHGLFAHISPFLTHAFGSSLACGNTPPP